MDNPEMSHRIDGENILAEKLLSGTISEREFLDQILHEDQKTETHENAYQNVAILESPKVARYFLEHFQENIRDDYHNLLSLSYFHIAQRAAVINHADPAEYFTKAYREAELIQSDALNDWKLYVFGTMKYLSKDVEGVDFAVGLIKNEVNKQALQRLKNGLIEHTSVDYARDYMNV